MKDMDNWIAVARTIAMAAAWAWLLYEWGIAGR